MMKMESFVRAGSSIESLLREELSDLLGDEWNGVGRSGVRWHRLSVQCPKGNTATGRNSIEPDGARRRQNSESTKHTTVFTCRAMGE